MHEAPYANNGLPMGLHVAPGLLGKGIGTDCLLCHAGRVAGQTVVGLGNSALLLGSVFALTMVFPLISLDSGEPFYLPAPWAVAAGGPFGWVVLGLGALTIGYRCRQRATWPDPWTLSAGGLGLPCFCAAARSASRASGRMSSRRSRSGGTSSGNTLSR